MFATTHTNSDNSLHWLETAPIGPDLMQFVDQLDVNTLGQLDQLSVLRVHSRLASHFHARVNEDISALEASLRPSEDTQHHQSVEVTAVEVGAILHLTRRSAEATTDMALQLVRRLPQVQSAMLRGDLDVARARVLLRGTEHLPAHTARRMVDQIIYEAAELTTGQLAARLRRLCMEDDPQDAAKRYEKAVDLRRVEVHANPEGTANLFGLDLPVERVSAISRYLDRAARKLKPVSDGRTMDQLRADILLDILEGAHTSLGAPRAGRIHLEVDLATLAELNDGAGDLAGFGPVTADLARQLADEMKRLRVELFGHRPCDGRSRM